MLEPRWLERDGCFELHKGGGGTPAPGGEGAFAQGGGTLFRMTQARGTDISRNANKSFMQEVAPPTMQLIIVTAESILNTNKTIPARC